MKTDWNLIKNVMNAAIDACEAVDRENLAEQERSATTNVAGVDVSVSDLMQSAWVYPENLSYSVIRTQHKLNCDKHYSSELARVISNVGKLCGELVDAQDTTSQVTGINPYMPNHSESVEEMVTHLSQWYRHHMVVNVKAAINQTRDSDPDLA